jgi:hypothetical protein
LETVASHTNFHLLHIPLLHLFVVKMSGVDELYRRAEEVLAKIEEVLHWYLSQCYRDWVTLKLFIEWCDLTQSHIRGQYLRKLGELIGHALIFTMAFVETNDQRAWFNENREEQMRLWKRSGWTLHH